MLEAQIIWDQLLCVKSLTCTDQDLILESLISLCAFQLVSMLKLSVLQLMIGPVE